MKTPEQIREKAERIAREQIEMWGGDLAYPTLEIATSAALAALTEMDRGHAPVETVMSKEEVEERQRTRSQAGLASIRRQPIDMIFIGGQQ